MLRNRAKRKYGTIAQEIQYSEFYRTAILIYTRTREKEAVVHGGAKAEGIPYFKKHERDAFPLSTKGNVSCSCSCFADWGCASRGCNAWGGSHVFDFLFVAFHDAGGKAVGSVDDHDEGIDGVRCVVVALVFVGIHVDAPRTHVPADGEHFVVGQF